MTLIPWTLHHTRPGPLEGGFCWVCSVAEVLMVTLLALIALTDLALIAITDSLPPDACDCSLADRQSCHSSASTPAAPSHDNRCLKLCCSKYFRCPRGAYGEGDDARDGLLQSWQEAALSRGWRPTSSQTAASRFEVTGISHHCSANWAKPPACSEGLYNARADAIWHPASPSPVAVAPLRRVYGGAVELVHNYKAGGSSLHEYLLCEYGSPAGKAQGQAATFTASVFAVRDPIKRFVSGVHEILQRFVNDACPLGSRCGNMDPHTSSMRTAWFSAAAAGLPAGAPLAFDGTRFVNLTRLLEAFIDDAMCCRQGSAAGLTDGLDHLMSQSTFATYAKRGIDLLVSLEDPEPALDSLARRLDKARNHTCSLPRINDGRQKAQGVPSAASLSRCGFLDMSPPCVSFELVLSPLRNECALASLHAPSSQRTHAVAHHPALRALHAGLCLLWSAIATGMQHSSDNRQDGIRTNSRRHHGPVCAATAAALFH